MYNQFSLPTKARATNLLHEIIAFRLRHDYLESDLSDFIMLKNRHEKTTGMPLDNDLLITLIMQKTTGPLQQHLRLNVRNISTFTEALEIVNSYVESRHLVVPSRNDGPGYWSTERKERIQRKRKRTVQGQRQRIWIQRKKECTKEKEKETVKVSKERKEEKE